MRRLIAIVLVVAAAAAGGCGADSHGSTTSSTTTTGPGLPRNLITNADLAQTQPGSPRRAILEWFQAIQFQDVAALRRLSTPAALSGLSDATLALWLSTFGPSFARPEITRVRNDAGKTSVRMLLLSYTGRSHTPTSAVPFTLLLTRAGGSWLVSDASLLRNSARAEDLPSS